MKSLLRPKYIVILVAAVAVFFVLKNELQATSDVLVTGSLGGQCPLHQTTLRLDTVPIVVRKVEPDSLTAAQERQFYPMAQEAFYLLSWFKDDEYKNYNRAEVWYCPKCRAAKS